MFSLQLLSGFFDTTSGPKVESSSYVNISKQLEVETNEILFMTDLPRGFFCYFLYLHVY